MGAGASAIAALPDEIDKATAKTFAGDKFDEAKFNKGATGGKMKKDAFLKAAGIDAPPKAGFGKATAAPSKAAGKAKAGGGAKKPAGSSSGMKKPAGAATTKKSETAAKALSGDAEASAAVAEAVPEEPPAAAEETPPPPPEPEPPPPPPEPVKGLVQINYNHYREKFNVVDGVVQWEEIDEKYSISFVFKGAWSCKLVLGDNRSTAEPIHPDGDGLKIEMRKDPDGFNSDDEEEVWVGTFSGLQLEVEPDKPAVYTLLVDEDPEDAKKMPTRIYKPITEDDFNDEEAGMGEDKSSCSCLFGNPCMQSYSCKDWHNRFEVAKKNGWKGFS